MVATTKSIQHFRVNLLITAVVLRCISTDSSIKLSRLIIANTTPALNSNMARKVSSLSQQLVPHLHEKVSSITNCSISDTVEQLHIMMSGEVESNERERELNFNSIKNHVCTTTYILPLYSTNIKLVSTHKKQGRKTQTEGFR